MECCAKSKTFAALCKTRSSHASRFSPTWTSANGALRRTAGSWWRWARAGWTCASRPCRRSSAKKSLCGCSRRVRRCSALPIWVSPVTLPMGMLLVTGPTGSGKSSSLYSCLNLLRRPTVNIVTVEDPVEYALPGINQVHVNTRAGLTFASTLRTILRQDPNVIMVGEIRDLETAEIAMKAAQTGHLVLSTLHTNDSISAVVRLLDLGIQDYLIASSVTGILAQRLVRKLCACHTLEPMTPEYTARLAEAGSKVKPGKIPWPAGCDLCDRTGYRGRLGVYELLQIDESIRSILRGRFKPDLVRNAARANGMRRLQEDALEKLRLGITSLDEIQRVVPFETLAPVECTGCGRELLPAFHYCPFCGTKRETGGATSRTESSFDVTQGILSS